MSNYVGNISTIVKTILLVFAGWCIGYLVSKGINLPITEEELSEIFFMIVCFVWAYIDAKNPNDFKWLGNAPIVIVEDESDLINEEYYEEEIEV